MVREATRAYRNSLDSEHRIIPACVECLGDAMDAESMALFTFFFLKEAEEGALSSLCLSEEAPFPSKLIDLSRSLLCWSRGMEFVLRGITQGFVRAEC